MPQGVIEMAAKAGTGEAHDTRCTRIARLPRTIEAFLSKVS
jgi:hypothetical protein